MNTPLFLIKGVEFDVCGERQKLFGTVVAVSGDNLASQALGGFSGLQSATRKCQFCMAIDTDIDSKVNLAKCIRTHTYYTIIPLYHGNRIIDIVVI